MHHLSRRAGELIDRHAPGMDQTDRARMMEAAVELPWMAVENTSRPMGVSFDHISLHGDAHVACTELADSVRQDGEYWPVCIYDLDRQIWRVPIKVRVAVTVESLDLDIPARGSTQTPLPVDTPQGDDDPRFEVAP